MDSGLPANETVQSPPASGRSVLMRKGMHTRKLMRRVLFALIAGLAISAAAGAADKSGSYTAFGAGNNTCESWLKERGKGEPRAWQLQQWLLGYVSAYNNWVHKGQNVADGSNAKEMFAWVDEYCADRSRDMLATVVEELILDLKKNQTPAPKANPTP